MYNSKLEIFRTPCVPHYLRERGGSNVLTRKQKKKGDASAVIVRKRRLTEQM